MHKLMLSYYNLPMISCSLDLIEKLVIVMKALRPTHYEIEIKQIVSGINDPEDNTDLNEKNMIIKEIKNL